MVCSPQGGGVLTPTTNYGYFEDHLASRCVAYLGLNAAMLPTKLLALYTLLCVSSYIAHLHASGSRRAAEDAA